MTTEPGQSIAATHTSLRGPTLMWAAATAILLFSMFLVIQDLAGANRPHELTNAPWVAGITLLNLVLCAVVFRMLVRFFGRRRGALGFGFHALAVGLVVVAILNGLIFAGAASTVPAVLGD